MARIKIIHPDESQGELKDEYDEAIKRAGYVAQILQIQSLNPKILHASIAFYKAIMFGPSGIKRSEREMLATVVSQINECFYWTHSHGEDLRKLIKDDDFVEAIKLDFRSADLNARQKALCEYAEKLTLKPAEMQADDLSPMREAGLSDVDIHDATQVIAYFNYINRIADGLDVDKEIWMPDRN